MDRIRTIIDKEWAEVFKNRMVLFVMIFMPLLFTILPLIILSVMAHSAPGSESTNMPAQIAGICGTQVSGIACVQLLITNEFLMFYMIMPIIIPITIAAYSIVGEKTTRSLEPLLATPITTEELLTGKALAAALPAIGATWISFLVFVLLLPVAGVAPAVRQHILGPVWLIAVFLIGPLMAILAVNFAIMISSRVSDARAAEQISAVLIVPVLVLIFGQFIGFIILNTATMLVFSLIIAVLDVGMIYLGARLFQREVILTKWR